MTARRSPSSHHHPVSSPTIQGPEHQETQHEPLLQISGQITAHALALAGIIRPRGEGTTARSAASTSPWTSRGDRAVRDPAIMMGTPLPAGSSTLVPPAHKQWSAGNPSSPSSAEIAEQSQAITHRVRFSSEGSTAQVVRHDPAAELHDEDDGTAASRPRSEVPATRSQTARIRSRWRTPPSSRIRRSGDRVVMIAFEVRQARGHAVARIGSIGRAIRPVMIESRPNSVMNHGAPAATTGGPP